METAWHDANVNEAANFLKTISQGFVISSQKVELTRPNDGRRILSQDGISCFSWIQLIVVLLFFQVSCEQFKIRCLILGWIAPISFVWSKLLSGYAAALVRKHA